MCVSMVSGFRMVMVFGGEGWLVSFVSRLLSKNPFCLFVCFFRWTKLRINMLPATIICEPISECFVASLIIGWAAHHVFRWDIMVFFMCHCLAWFIFDYIQLRGVQVCGYTRKGSQ